MTNIKLLGFWVLGSALLLAALWILKGLEMVVGVTPVSFYISMFIAFILVMLAGLCWISVAVATRRKIL